MRYSIVNINNMQYNCLNDKEPLKEGSMKFSFMTFSCPELSVREVVMTARRYGYDGVELRVEAKHAHGVELSADQADRVRIRKEFEDGGVAIACVATSCCYSDPAETATQIDKTPQYIDLAGDLGCGHLRVFGGVIKSGLTREQAIERLAESLRSVADLAAKRKVRVCLETHDDWCDPAHVAEVMRRVDHEWIAVNWDIMHPVRTKLSTMQDAFDTLKPWIHHAHIHDCEGYGENITFTSIGKGIIDHKLALRRLTALKRDLFLSFEWFNMGPHERHLPAELTTMRNYEKELGVAH